MTTNPETDRLNKIKDQLAAVPPGQYHWRGSTDYPDSIYLGAPSWVDADGKLHMGRNVIGLVRHEVTRDEAKRRGVDAPDFLETPAIHREGSGRPLGVRVGDGRVVRYEPEETYDERYDAAVEAAREDAITEYLTDPYGQPRTEYRLAFTDDHGFLVEANILAIYEVAPAATDRNDPHVYRADITGFRHPVAQFLADARSNIDWLVAEVEQLLAERDAALAHIEQLRPSVNTGFKGMHDTGARHRNPAERGAASCDVRGTNTRGALRAVADAIEDKPA